MQIKDIPLDRIEQVDLKPDKGFVDTVRLYGIFQNVIMMETEDGYGVVSGRRRVNAALEAGHETIRALVLPPDTSEADVALITLIENVKRSGNPAAEAKAIKTLLDLSLTQEEIAATMGVDRSQVAKRALLLKLTPKLFEKLEKGELRPSIAREIAQMPTEEQQNYEDRDTVTLKEIKEARRLKTLEKLEKVSADHLEPEPPKTTKKETRTDFNLSKEEKEILKHAYTFGVFKMDQKGKRPVPMKDAAADYGKDIRRYSETLLNARRKIISRICEEMF